MGVKGTTNFDYLDVDEITTDSVVIGTTPIPPANLDLLKYLTATYYEINQMCDMDYRVQDVKTTPYQVTSASDGEVIVLDKVDGLAITLAGATGSGIRLKMYVKTTFTSDCTIKVTGDDIMKGYAILGTDDSNAVKFFPTAVDTDTIILTGTTTGGIAGATIELTDIAANTWAVAIISDASGSEATPFSATVGA
jgi:hypothetical protein